MASAFVPRQQDEYLSVNWLEYWGLPDLGAALDCIRRELNGERNLQVKLDGRFAVLNVLDIKDTIRGMTKRPSSVMHQPTPDMKSHAGVFGFFQNETDVAAELAMLVSADNTFPGIVDS